MENGDIRDDQITASSEWSDLDRAASARLNLVASDETYGSWTAAKADLNQWLQVDFERSTVIKGISTQGRQDYGSLVKNYTISFSNDGKNFQNYEHGGITKVIVTRNG